MFSVIKKIFIRRKNNIQTIKNSNATPESKKKKSITQDDKDLNRKKSSSSIKKTFLKYNLLRYLIKAKFHLCIVVSDTAAYFYVCDKKNEIIDDFTISNEQIKENLQLGEENITKILNDFPQIKMCEIIIDTYNVKYTVFDTPLSNIFSSESNNYCNARLLEDFQLFLLKKYYLIKKNPNKSYKYLLMGLKANDFIIELIQLIDKSTELDIKHFLFLDILLSNIQEDKKVKKSEKFQLTIIEYSENEVCAIITYQHKLLFSRRINYYNRENSKENNNDNLIQEIEVLLKYVIRNYEMIQDELENLIFCMNNSNLFTIIADSNDYWQKFKILHEKDLKLTEKNARSIDKIILRNINNKENVSFLTKKLKNFHNIRIMINIAVITSMIVFVLLISIQLFFYFSNIQLVNLRKTIENDINIKQTNYQTLMLKMGYDAQETNKIAKISNLYQQFIKNKKCSKLSIISELIQINWQSFKINKIIINDIARYKNHNDIIFNLTLDNNQQEFFKILKDIQDIENQIKKYFKVNKITIKGLPINYSLSAIYNSIDLEISYVNSTCYEN